ncbi:N-acetylglucosamine-6-phosphate deacetylase [Acetivibrio saccincola]|jgi:N-acetylglucosamine-6-phosphate deacetylase|nr:N-acetylglucosamine-6-phosphate deacetylase [Acetivibrio saccincola]PQQ65602.1 N-acetylglucosamine-6-phosphate deacetylase [Acetivibrio saccincola]HQD28129.1 N-acetylglucosamine-6-phosphate deacetylase [Acetivibrio saccincola]
MKLIKNGLVFYDNNSFEKKDILIKDGKIADIRRGISKNGCEVIDAEGFWVLPGFIDIHTHGGGGYDIMNSKCRELESLSRFFVSKGVTAFLPAVMTAPLEDMMNAVRNINQYINKINKPSKNKIPGAKIIGINMEGPFISQKYKGSHPKEHIIPPSVSLLERFIHESGGNIKIVTVAPEAENAISFIEHFKRRGIVFSAGHTGADYKVAAHAFEKGFSHVTHLFNAMAGIHHRDPGIAGAALERDNITVELICDGVHIDPAMIKIVLKCKPIDNIVLITDSIIAAGAGNGEYSFAGKELYIENGCAKHKNGVIAGSVVTMIDIFKNMVGRWGVPIENCIKMTSANAAKVAGIYHKKGSLTCGKDADIIIMDKKLNLLATIAEGNIVYRA